jgi:hypothetical protein
MSKVPSDGVGEISDYDRTPSGGFVPAWACLRARKVRRRKRRVDERPSWTVSLAPSGPSSVFEERHHEHFDNRLC